MYLEDETITKVYALVKRVSRSIAHRSKVNTYEKNKTDFVTNVDLFSENELVAGLKEIDDIPCLSEESVSDGIVSDTYWVIDPIDGTTNFIHKYPSYCIAIAKIVNNSTEYGFVYNMADKELFVGIRDQGSYLINSRRAIKRICVSKTEKLEDSLIGFGCPYDKSKGLELFRLTAKFFEKCHDLKRKGPASLDICYVACGRLDAYFEFDLKPWDYAAAKLILEEAGGVLTDWEGYYNLFKSCNVVASNNRLHGEMLTVLGE